MNMNLLNCRRWPGHMILVTMAACSLVWSGSASAAEPATVEHTTSLQASATTDCAALLNHAVRPLMGPQASPLCTEYGGKVLLIVNTASKCGFTPQFESLEALHERYGKQGFEVLGFPSEDFRQELESEEAVAEFCELNYGVSFPMFQKVHVTKPDAHPLYHDLAAATGNYPGWNFNKYLVDRDGKVVAHYGSSVLPTGAQLVKDIEALL